MTAPAAPSVTRSTFSTSTTDHLASMPAAVAAGRLLVAVASHLNAIDEANLDDGWVLVDEQQNSGLRLSVLAKETDGTEGGTTANFPTSAITIMSVHVYYFSEAGYTIADCLALSATFATGSNTTPDPPSLTHGWGSTDFISVAAAASYSGTFSSYPSGYSGGVYDAGSLAVIGSAYKSVTGASSENPGTFTVASGFLWVAATIAVRLNPTPPADPAPEIDSVTPSTFAWGQAGIVIAGDNFGSSKGSGKVEISNNATYASGTKQVQTTTSWSNTSITITSVPGSFGAGSFYVWITNDNGDRNATGFEVTATEDEPPPAPEAPSGTVLAGALQVEIHDDSAPGVIDDVFSANIDEGVNMLPSASFSSWLGAAGVDVATGGKEISIRRQGEGELFRGFIDKIEVQVDEAGAETVRYQLVHLGIELQKRNTGRSILVLDESITSAASAILSGTGWSFTLTGSGFPSTVTKEWVNMPLLQAIAELAEIAGGYWRVDPVSRSIEISNEHEDSGILLTNPDELDPREATIGAIQRITRVEEDLAAVVNRVWFEIKTDQARLITLQEATRNTPYAIESEFIRSPRPVAGVAKFASLREFNEPLQALGENRYVIALASNENFTNEVVARLGGQYMGQIAYYEPSVGFPTPVWGGVPPKGAPVVDIPIDFAVTLGAVSFEGVDQVNPVRDVEVNENDSTGTISVTVDSEAGDLVVAIVYMIEADFNHAVTAASGEQFIVSSDHPTGGDDWTAWWKPGQAGSTSMSFNISNSTSRRLVIAISLRPALKYYIEDTDSQDTYGLHELPLSLGTFSEVEVDNEALANTGYDYIADYLTKRKVPPKFYGIDFAFLPGSPLEWAVGDTMATKYRGHNLQIDDDLIVTRRTQSFDAAGVRSWSGELATVTMFRRDEQGAWLLQQIMSRLNGAQSTQV